MRTVPNPPGGSLHDFVPFYFAPRSPMLSAIEHGNVVGCSLKQTDILHFETTVDRLITDNTDFVFYDRNATLFYSQAFTDLSQLTAEIAWDLITETPQLDGFCKYFFSKSGHDKYFDRMERRQAEFLVKHRVELSSMTKIGVIDQAKAQIVAEILVQAGINLPVEVKTDWYF